VSEAARSFLDGHLVLSSALAHAGRYPAIGVLSSTSRTMEAVTTAAHQRAAVRVRRALAALDRIEDARSLGILPTQCDEKAAVALEAALRAFLRQGRESAPPSETLSHLERIAEEWEERVGD